MRINGVLLGLVTAFGLAMLAFAQVQSQDKPMYNIRHVKSEPSKLDALGVWAVDIEFKDPRSL